MDRLTDRSKEMPTPISNHATYYAQCVNKLADYEDAEEQGRLIILPCKVGDTIWEFKYGCTIGPDDLCYIPSKACGNCKSLTCSIAPRKVIDVADAALLTRRWGKTVFRFREEAEAALGGDGNG